MNIRKFPITSWRRMQNRRGKRSVSCIVSNRWLHFGEPSQQLFNSGTPISLDVMTETEDENGKLETKKLCTLIVTVKQLQKLMNEIGDGA